MVRIYGEAKTRRTNQDEDIYFKVLKR